MRVKADRLLYQDIQPEQGMLYTIQFMLTNQREMEMIYTSAADRDEMFQRITAAISPGVVIESQYARPVYKPKLSDDSPEKTYTRSEVFLTRVCGQSATFGSCDVTNSKMLIGRG